MTPPLPRLRTPLARLALLVLLAPLPLLALACDSDAIDARHVLVAFRETANDPASVRRIGEGVPECAVQPPSSSWTRRTAPDAPAVSIRLPPDLEPAPEFGDAAPHVTAWLGSDGAFLIISLVPGREILLDPVDRRALYVYEGICALFVAGEPAWATRAALAVPRSVGSRLVGPNVLAGPPQAYLAEIHFIAPGEQVLAAAIYAPSRSRRYALLGALQTLRISTTASRLAPAR